MPITIDGSNGITQAGEFNSDSSFGFKNRIINGAMTFDQRNAGASVTPASGAYTLDRWQVSLSQSSKLTVQQDAGAITAPAGFNDYLGVTSSSAYSITSSDLFLLNQPIEGFNCADFNWGTANAKTITVSFWVRSSGLTYPATFGGVINNHNGSRSYPFSYTISSANTWEQKSITIAGDTSGTWQTGNTGALIIRFGLGVGSTYSGTAGSWSGSTFYSATGATSVVGTNGATWYITGVQLEVGSTATSFDYRPYGTELALCQRYYETSFDIGTAPANAVNDNFEGIASFGAQDSQQFSFKVYKRAAPTMTYYSSTKVGSPTAGQWQFLNSGSAWANGVATQTNRAIMTGFSIYVSSSGNLGSGQASSIVGNWAASAEL